MRQGWKPGVVAVGFFVAVLVCWGLGGDHVLQPVLRGWDRLPGVAALVELVRPFGRGEVAVLVVAMIGLAGRRALAGRMLLALALAGVFTWMLKVGVGRIRPNGEAFSFVSGDTSTAWALLPLLAWGWGGRCGAVALAVAVGLARIVQGYHWPSDVLGGAAVGLFAGAVAMASWPVRPWRWLTTRATWTWFGGGALAVAIAWAAWTPSSGTLRTFLLVWAPPLLAWGLWQRLRPRLRAGLPAARWAPWLVAALLALALAGLAASTTLLDRDEPRNALAAREMLASGHWLVPTFNGEWRLHKPILPYWLMTVALRSGLPADLACRLPAVLAMAGVVVLTALTARRLAVGLAPGRVALVTALVLATSPLVVVCGSAATTDAVLLLGISATMLILVEAMLGGVRWWQVAVAALAIAWAVLAKGPMGLLVPVASVAGTALAAGWLRRRDPGLLQPVGVRTWWLLAGAVGGGSLLALAWFVPANAATGGAMFREMIGNQVVERALAARESHGGGFWVSLPYYLPVLLVACFAWLPALAVVLRAPGIGLRLEVRILLLAWALPVLVAVTLVQTKLPHYLLPMLPPLAVLLAAALEGAAAPGWWRWGWRAQSALLGLLVAGLIAGPLTAALLQDGGVLSTSIGLAPLIVPAVAVGLSVWLLVAIAGRAAAAGRRQVFAVAVTLGMAVMVLALILHVRRLEVFKPAPGAAQAVRDAVPAGVPVAVCGFDEPSLLFYLGPAYGPVAIFGGAGALERWAAQSGPGACIAERRRWDEVSGNALEVEVLARIPGYNYSNGKSVELIVLKRR